MSHRLLSRITDGSDWHHQVRAALHSAPRYGFSSFTFHTSTPNPLLRLPEIGYFGLPLTPDLQEQLIRHGSLPSDDEEGPGRKVSRLTMEGREWLSWRLQCIQRVVAPLGIKDEDLGISLHATWLFTEAPDEPKPLFRRMSDSNPSTGPAGGLIIVLPCVSEYTIRTLYQSYEDEIVIRGAQRSSQTMAMTWRNGADVQFSVTRGCCIVLEFSIHDGAIYRPPEPVEWLQRLRTGLSLWLERCATSEQNRRILLCVNTMDRPQFQAQLQHLCCMARELGLRIYTGTLSREVSGWSTRQGTATVDDPEEWNTHVTQWIDPSDTSKPIWADLDLDDFDFQNLEVVPPVPELLYPRQKRLMEGRSFLSLGEYDAVMLWHPQYHVKALASLFKADALKFADPVSVEDQGAVQFAEAVISEVPQVNIKPYALSQLAGIIKKLLNASVHFSKPGLFYKVAKMVGVRDTADAHRLFTAGWPHAWKGIVKVVVEKHDVLEEKLKWLHMFLGGTRHNEFKEIATELIAATEPNSPIVPQRLSRLIPLSSEEVIFSCIVNRPASPGTSDTEYWLSVFKQFKCPLPMEFAGFVAPIIAAHKPAPALQPIPLCRRFTEPLHALAYRGTSTPMRKRIHNDTEVRPDRVPPITIADTLFFLGFCVRSSYVDLVPNILAKLNVAVRAMPAQPPGHSRHNKNMEWLLVIENILEILMTEGLRASDSPYAGFFQDVILEKMLPILQRGDDSEFEQEFKILIDPGGVYKDVISLRDALGPMLPVFETVWSENRKWCPKDTQLAKDILHAARNDVCSAKAVCKEKRPNESQEGPDAKRSKKVAA